MFGNNWSEPGDHIVEEEKGFFYCRKAKRLYKAQERPFDSIAWMVRRATEEETGKAPSWSSVYQFITENWNDN